LDSSVVSYGSGDVLGTTVVDRVEFGPHRVLKQEFGSVLISSPQFFGMPFRGILGLAFGELSGVSFFLLSSSNSIFEAPKFSILPWTEQNGLKPFFENLITQRSVAKNLFSFYL
jgi:hypothetical protein